MDYYRDCNEGQVYASTDLAASSLKCIDSWMGLTSSEKQPLQNASSWERHAYFGLSGSLGKPNTPEKRSALSQLRHFLTLDLYRTLREIHGLVTSHEEPGCHSCTVPVLQGTQQHWPRPGLVSSLFATTQRLDLASCPTCSPSRSSIPAEKRKAVFSHNETIHRA